MASVSGKSITSKVITQTWQPKAAPRGDWHGTWHAIHHQSHVAVILHAANVSDFCMCVRRICVGVAVFCLRASDAAPSQQTGTEARQNSKNYLYFGDEGNILCACVNSNVRKSSRLGGYRSE